jgi:hypothetical protein
MYTLNSNENQDYVGKIDRLIFNATDRIRTDPQKARYGLEVAERLLPLILGSDDPERVHVYNSMATRISGAWHGLGLLHKKGDVFYRDLRLEVR